MTADPYDEIEFAGPRMRITETSDGHATISYDERGTGRTCGECQLCCKLLPIDDLRKPAGQLCRHAKPRKGCTIYPSRPFACKSWACRWLADPQTQGLPRPDRAHYVIDLAYDYVTFSVQDAADIRLPVMQIWVDPAFPLAHRAASLRSFMLRMAELRRVGAIVRYGSRQAVVILAPPLVADRQWHELTGGTIVARTEREHRILDGWSNVTVEGAE